MRTPLFFLLLGYCLLSSTLYAKVELQPHRAYYTVSLVGRPSPQSALVDIRGTMLIELSRESAGWVTQHLSDTWLYYNDDSVEQVRCGYITYEADDGSFFKFHTYCKNNDELVENTQGIAKKKGDVTEVTYTKPDKKRLTLSGPILFPQQLTKLLLKGAQAGEKIIPTMVFDGRSPEGAFETNTFINSQRVVEPGHQLANQPFWPMQFAVYSHRKIDYEPSSTTTQDLLSNGIIKQYVTEYDVEGEKVHGVLDRVELLQEPSITP